MECLASNGDRGFIKARLDIALGGDNVANIKVYNPIQVRCTAGAGGMGFWVETVCLLVLGCMDSSLGGNMV